MRRAVHGSIAALLVLAAPVSHAQQPVDATSAPIAGVIGLRPTDHPRVPRELSELWMAPDKGHVRTAAEANLAAAVKLEAEGSYARAANLLSQPATPQPGPLGTYVEFHKGLAELKLGRPNAARAIFRAVQTRELAGTLVEAAALREAECDEALGDQAAALAVYERLAATKTAAPDEVWLRVGKAAKAVGDTEKAQAAFGHIYYEYPTSDSAATAEAELGLADPIAAGTARYRRELGRAERLFAAKDYTTARTTFVRLRSAAQGDDHELVNVRIAESDYFLKHRLSARDGLRPYLESTSRRPEVLYFYAASLQDLGDRRQYLSLIQRIATDFPTDRWTEDALNHLANVYLREDDDESADWAFRELFERFPTGRYAERAAWEVGWRAYRNQEYRETIRVFERGAITFPRSDYRPAWLYWSARAYEAVGDRQRAQGRHLVTVTDYLNTYYGRLALPHLDGVTAPGRALFLPLRDDRSPLQPEGAAPATSLPPNASVIRALLAAQMYDQAADELRYAQKMWGDSAPIEATIAWTYRERGQSESGAKQFNYYRGAINAMKRAYPQYLTAGGEQLPRDILRVIYPVAYWDLIQKYSAEHELDPYMVAALAAQESTFVANIRSIGRAVGVMQLEAVTARAYARRLKISYSARTLTDPETNIRIGTAYLADKIREFGDLHLALASYNAGERPVHRWVSERQGLSREEFIDDIPYPDTRNYVKKILATTEDYRRLYGPAAGVASDDEIPPATRSAAAADVDPSLGAKKKDPPPPRPPVRKKRPSA